MDMMLRGGLVVRDGRTEAVRADVSIMDGAFAAQAPRSAAADVFDGRIIDKPRINSPVGQNRGMKRIQHFECLSFPCTI